MSYKELFSAIECNRIVIIEDDFKQGEYKKERALYDITRMAVDDRCRYLAEIESISQPLHEVLSKFLSLFDECFDKIGVWDDSIPYGCESIVEPQEEGGESEGGEDVEEQTGAGTDVRSRLDVRFDLQPVEKDLNRLPQGTDAGGHGIFGNKNIVLFPLSRRDERDVPLGLQMGSPFCVDIGTICVEPAVCDRCAVQIDLLCSPQVAETGFADLYGAGDGKLMRAQLGKNVQLDAVIPQVLRGISC